MKSISFLSLIGATCLAAGSAQAQVISLSPIADTYLEGGSNLGAGELNSTVNFGTVNPLIVKTQSLGSSLDNGRSAWFRFDGSLLQNDYAEGDVSLTFNGANLADHTFHLWGVSELSASENFSELGLTFNNLDAGFKSILIGADFHGAIDVMSGLAVGLGSTVADGTVLTFNSAALADFVNNDTNDVITFFLTRADQDNAITAQIFSREHETLGPVLAVPEPSTYAAIFGGLVLGFAFIRRRRLS